MINGLMGLQIGPSFIIIRSIIIVMVTNSSKGSRMRTSLLILFLIVCFPLYLRANSPSLSPDDYTSLAIETLRESLVRQDVEPLEEFIAAAHGGLFKDKHVPQRIAKRTLGIIGSGMVGETESFLKAEHKKSLEAIARGITTKRSVLFDCKPRKFEFPRDDGKHSFLAEWWYFNGHMYTEDGSPFGYELCFFRVLPAIYFCHVAVTDEHGNKFSYERKMVKPWNTKISRKRADLQMGPWWVKQTGKGAFTIHGEVKGYTFNLNLQAEREPFVINGNGVIDMPEGANSYYYSMTKIKHKGILTKDGHPMAVTGQSWYDHQWGNFIAFRHGWDWFSFQMDDGSEYNLFSFRLGNDEQWKQYVNILRPDGSTIHEMGMKIERLAWWKSPKTSLVYVTKWRIHLPCTGETIEVDAVIPQQEVASRDLLDMPPTYWEGRCKTLVVDGPNKGTKGLCYAEHFPYRKYKPPSDAVWEQ